MTSAALIEVLQDRINMLAEALDGMTFQGEGETVAYARERAYLEGRLEESRVCLRLVECVEHPLFEVREGRIRQVSEPWGKQLRGDWPTSTFGGC